MKYPIVDLLVALDPVLWRELGFERWEWQGMKGVHRHVTFRKEGVLGEVASYFAEDYLVWTHRGRDDEELLLSCWRPIPGVISHRFLFLDEVTAPRRSKGFCLGLRGWVEVQRYRPGERPHRKFRDLAWLVDQVAACIVRHRQEGVEGASRP